MSHSFSHDIVRFKIEVGVEEKFTCKYVSKQRNTPTATVVITMRCAADVFTIDLDFTVNMLGLCDPSNLLLVLSAEERRALLKLL